VRRRNSTAKSEMSNWARRTPDKPFALAELIARGRAPGWRADPAAHGRDNPVRRRVAIAVSPMVRISGTGGPPVSLTKLGVL